MKNGWTRPGIWVLLAALVALKAFSSPAETLRTTADFELVESGLSADGEALELSLEDAIGIALRRNLDLHVERYQRSRSLLSIMLNEGIYDLELSARLDTREDNAPAASQLESSSSESANANFQVDQLFPIGGTATVGWANRRSESDLSFNNFNPSYSSGLQFGYSQPLFRNFGKLATERSLLLARTNAQVSREDFQVQVEAVIADVSNSYWDVVQARAQLEVSLESLRLAEELHEMNRIQVEVGTLAPLELVRSEAGVASRQEDIIRFRANVEDAEDRLRQLLNLTQGPLWNTPIQATTDPEIEFRKLDLDEAITIALAERPEIRRQQLNLDNLDIEARFQANQLKPRLDVDAGYNLAGIGGTSLDPAIDGGGYNGALEQVFDADFTGWSVGFTFAYPLQNRAARAAKAQADLALEQGEVELERQRQIIITEVRRAARALRTAQEQIRSAEVSSRLELKNLEAEQRRYENGLATSFQILETQEDLSNARNREVNAVSEYRRQLVTFDRAIGQLLESFGVVLEGADDS